MKKIFSNFDVSKLSSGRFILTMVGAISYLMIVHTICQILYAKSGELSGTEILATLSTLVVILSNIFTFYFVKRYINRKDPEESPENE